MKKLEEAEVMPKYEVSQLYRSAAAHLALPPLMAKSDETDKCFLLRAKFALKARMMYVKNYSRTAKKSKKCSLLFKPGINPYLTWKTQRDRIETARGVAREMQDSYQTGEIYSTMTSAPRIPEDLFARIFHIFTSFRRTTTSFMSEA